MEFKHTGEKKQYFQELNFLFYFLMWHQLPILEIGKKMKGHKWLMSEQLANT